MSSKLTALTTNPSPLTTDLIYAVPAAGGTQYKSAISAYSLVVGPSSATDGAISLFDSTTGKLLKNSNLVYNQGTSTLSVPAGFTITPSATGITINGNLGLGVAANDTIAVTVGGPTVLSGTNAFGLYGASTAPSNVTGTFIQFNSNPRTDAASFVLGALAHFSASSTTVGSGSSISEMNGFRVTTGMTQGAVNYGFRGALAVSGTARWNLYMDGTAPNFIAGDLRLGSTTGTKLADSSGAFTLTGGTGNMTITAGTGNSRTLALQTTTSGGVATTAITLDATQGATFANNITMGGTAILTKPGGTIPIFTTNSAITSGAGASAGTLTNAPSVGNPTKWIPINDNGTTRYIPAW